MSSLVGEVREGVTLVQNLVQIIRSPRLGTRQLSRQLPELAGACHQIEEAVQRLAKACAAALSTEPGLAEALDDLSSLAISCQRAVCSQLTDGHGEGLGAKRRLEIDALACTAAERLTELCQVGELVSFATVPRRATVDLADVVGVGRERPQPERTARVDTRLLSLLLDMVARSLAGVPLESALGTDIMGMGRALDGRLSITVRRRVSPPAEAQSSEALHRVLSAVARFSGHDWTVGEAGGTLTL